MHLPLHLGHLGEVAGHDHWVAGAVIAGAAAAGVWAWLGRRDDAEPEGEGEAEPAPEEAREA